MLQAILNFADYFIKNYPLNIPLAMPVVFLLLARYRRTYPSGMLVLWAILPTVITAGILMRRDWMPLLMAMDVSLLLVALSDALTPAKESSFEVQREAPRIASLRKLHRVSLTISNKHPRAQSVLIRDTAPAAFEVIPDELRPELPARSRATVHYDLMPLERGAFEWNEVHIRTTSRLGLWNRYLQVPCPSTVRVYPDLKQLSEYALLARTNRLTLMGVRRTRRVGQDNEFERLRDYTSDDNYKHIDWRSTARRNKLTVKDFQTNQSQRIIFMIDCGRMMTNQAAGVSLLDHAFNAMLMLSHVALTRGDAVGLITFSNEIHASVPPKSGIGQMNHLLHAVFDRFPSLVESRYEDAFLHLSARCRKRSLVVLITNVVDEVNSSQIHQYLTSISKRHLPLAVLLRDHRLFEPLYDPAPAGPALYRAAAAAEILTWRHQVIRDLQHRGVLVMDQFPERMTAPLINRYLEIKARHLL